MPLEERCSRKEPEGHVNIMTNIALPTDWFKMIVIMMFEISASHLHRNRLSVRFWGLRNHTTCDVFVFALAVGDRRFESSI